MKQYFYSYRIVDKWNKQGKEVVNKENTEFKIYHKEEMRSHDCKTPSIYTQICNISHTQKDNTNSVIFTSTNPTVLNA